MRKTLSAIVVLLLAFACGCQPAQQASAAASQSEEDPGIEDNPPNSDGKPFLDDLSRATREADRVVLIEHSYIYDNTDVDIHSKFLPERKYKEVVLAGAEKDRFLSAVGAIDPYMSMYASACISEPHHRFEFYRNGKRMNTLEVCFQCGQLEWDGTSKGEPKTFYQGLAKFVKSVGLQPDQDWHALAKQVPRS